MSVFQNNVKIISALLEEANTPSIIKSDVSYAVRFLADSADQLTEEVSILRDHIREMYKLAPDSSSPEEVDDFLVKVKELAGMKAKPIKPLQQDQMAAIIEVLNEPPQTTEADQRSPDKHCICVDGFNCQCIMHGKHQ